MRKKIDVIFMGTPQYAQTILEALVKSESVNVVCVYTQPDKPVGRKKILTPPLVKTLAQEKNIDVYQAKSLRERQEIERLLKISCDYIVVAAYGQILPKQILEHAPCINLHASILPNYRGASPIQQTLLNGDRTTGVTAMLMEEGLDTGDILSISSLKVGDDELAESLFLRLTDMAALLTLDVLENFSNFTPLKQEDALSTHCKKITKKDGEVAFKNAKTLYNKYRAFTPWPGIFLQSGLKLKHIELIESSSRGEEGQIIAIEKSAIIVSCLEGSIRIFRVQAPSKKDVDILSYIRGKRLEIENYLS